MTWDQNRQNGSPDTKPGGLVRSAVLAGPCAAFSSNGGDVSALLVNSGLSTQQLVDPESILHTHEYLDALARIGHASDDELLFHAGVNTPLGDFGLAGQAVQSAATLGEAIDLTRDILGYLQSNSIMEITTGGSRYHLRYSADFGEPDELAPDLQYSIGVFSSLVSQVQHEFDPELTVYYPGAKNALAEQLPSTTRFRESRDAIIEFDRRLLQSSMPKSNDDKAEILRRFLGSNTIDEAAKLGMADTVRQLVDHSMGIAKPSQQNICGMLGIGARSLQRALRKEGTSFRQIVESSRKWIALRELQGGRGVTETSFFLGYDHPQNLTSACYRWFGKSPSSL